MVRVLRRPGLVAVLIVCPLFLFRSVSAQPDVQITGLDGLVQVGRVGGAIALSLETTLCNVGDKAVDWFAVPDERHPFMAFNLYRLENDVLEQIGLSWAKHGVAATQEDRCDLGCQHVILGLRLGVGCSDSYSPEVNADQEHMGPRREIGAWFGTFDYLDSHFFLQGGDTHNQVEHRLQTRDQDIDPSLHPGARFFVEAMFISHDDKNPTNSIAWREFRVVRRTLADWQFEFLETDVTLGPVLDVWDADLQVNTEDNSLLGDGTVYVSSKVTSGPTGVWHYEYALFNYNLDRSVAAFGLEMTPETWVEKVGFGAPVAEEGYSNDPWEWGRENGFHWDTGTVERNPFSNPIRWGTLYNFRFDSIHAPVESVAILTTFLPSSVRKIPARVLSPEPGGLFLRGDCEGNGLVGGDVGDALIILLYLFVGGAEPPCMAACDFDISARVDMVDAIRSMTFSFYGSPDPGLPFPDCGPLALESDRWLGCENQRTECP